MTGYAEIGVTSNYSFLRGASHPHELVKTAAALGYAAIGIADRNTLAGVVRAYAAWQELEGPKPRLLTGARLSFVDGTPDILAYPTDRAAYGRLCRLLSMGKLHAPKGECHITKDDLLQWQDGLLLVLLPACSNPSDEIEKPSHKLWNSRFVPIREEIKRFFAPKSDPHAILAAITCLRKVAADRLWLGVSMPHRGDDQERLDSFRRIARTTGLSLIATNDVLYHSPERHELQDVITCIREHVTLDMAGRLLEANAEKHLKTEEDMAVLFRQAPEALAETLCFANRITFSLDQLQYNYPKEPIPEGMTAQSYLEKITWKGAEKHYGEIPSKVRHSIERELALIGRMEIAPYFLTVHDIVNFARRNKILCQGRGSAANSAVCYVLGITAVDPMQIELLFDRFISEERREPPDIDVDFEHERREEVIQYVFDRYGIDHAALAATVICYRPRSAIRETGKVFGLTEDVTARLASSVWGNWGTKLKQEQVRQGLLDPQNRMIERAVSAANDLIGFPRHLSQHVGGFVLTYERLDEIVPVGRATMKDRFFIEWDKDDIDTLRILKVDVLALGMLTCIRKAFDLIRMHENKSHDLDNVERENPEVYEMLQRADAIGVFQVESRAQMNMLPRLRPKKFYDLVIEVAIVRPGPIQGNMVHPYLRRRDGVEDVDYPSPKYGDKDELLPVLEKTMGVPLFQEQAMKLAIVAAQFTPQEANGLRRAMATFRNLGTIDKFRDKFINGMVGRGYEQDFAERCFKQIEGFGSYGFPESHAASFAHLVYISAYIKKFHPAAFACALLNSQPMGFYAPAEIVRDAREHNVKILPIDVNFSSWDNTVEFQSGALALRLGFCQVDGFKENWAKLIVMHRGNQYSSVEILAHRTRLPNRALAILAEADCFQSINVSRREILWTVRRIPEEENLPLFTRDYILEQEEEIAPLPVMPFSEQVLADYEMLRLSLRAHLMAFLRSIFRQEGVLDCSQISMAPDGTIARCAGVVLTRQMPGSAGVVFVTLSDELGVTNVVIWPRLVQAFRREIMGARLMLVEGRVQRSPKPGNVVHLVAARIIDRSNDLDRLSVFDSNASFEMQKTISNFHHPRNVRIVPRSRDFH